MSSRFIEKVETLDVSVGQWIASFLGIIFIRFFLENISSPTPSFPAVFDTLTLVHYGLFYLAAILLTSLILRIFVPNIAGISKFFLSIFPVIWMPPIIDLIASGGAGSKMAYVFASGTTLLQDFFTLGGPYQFGGITLGIKVELIIILCGIFYYVFSKTKNAGKACLAVIISYLAVFLLLALPSFMAFGSSIPLSALVTAFSNSHLMENFIRPTAHLSYTYGLETLFNLGMAQFLYLFNFILIVAWLALYRSRIAIALLKNIRPGRIIHFAMMIVLGACLAVVGHSGTLFHNAADAIAFLNLIIAFVCAWLFAVGVNDLADVAIDEISNAGRPLIEGTMSAPETRDTNLVLLIWSLLGGYLGGYWAFFAVATFTAAYYVYSAHPLRLKQVPLLATFLISLACLSSALAGFYFASSSKLLSAFPLHVLFLILISYTLLTNIKDIKDIEGDRAAGITTIPVAFPRQGKKIVGLLFAAAFFCVPLLLNVPVLYLPSLAAGIIGYMLITARRYREWPLFVVYFAYVAVAIWLVAVR